MAAAALEGDGSNGDFKRAVPGCLVAFVDTADRGSVDADCGVWDVWHAAKTNTNAALAKAARSLVHVRVDFCM